MLAENGPQDMNVDALGSGTVVRLLIGASGEDDPLQSPFLCGKPRENRVKDVDLRRSVWASGAAAVPDGWLVVAADTYVRTGEE